MRVTVQQWLKTQRVKQKWTFSFFKDIKTESRGTRESLSDRQGCLASLHLIQRQQCCSKGSCDVSESQRCSLQPVPLGQSRHQLSDEALTALCSCLDLCPTPQISLSGFVLMVVFKEPWEVDLICLGSALLKMVMFLWQMSLIFLSHGRRCQFGASLAQDVILSHRVSPVG